MDLMQNGKVGPLDALYHQPEAHALMCYCRSGEYVLLRGEDS